MGCKAGEWRIEARKLQGKMFHREIGLLLGVHRNTVKRFFETDMGDSQILMSGTATGWTDSVFIEPHIYRVPRKLDMGPVVAAARAALEARG